MPGDRHTADADIVITFLLYFTVPSFRLPMYVVSIDRKLMSQY